MDNQTLIQLGAGVISLVGTGFTGWMAYRTLKANQNHELRQRYSRKKSILDLKDREAIFRLQEEMREEYKTTIAELRDRVDELQAQVISTNEEKYKLSVELSAIRTAHDTNLKLIQELRLKVQTLESYQHG